MHETAVELVRAALELAASGPFTPSRLAKKLGIGLREAEALIGVLLAHGYIREVKPADCAACPLSGVCGSRFQSSVRAYELTEKGRRIIMGGASP